MDFAAKIRARLPLLGTLISIPSVESAELLASCGYDWLFLDLEHTAISLREAQLILQSVDLPVLVRVESNSEKAISKVLDIGASGILVPQIKTAEEAMQAVSWAKFPIEGSRGAGLSRASGYGVNFAEYFAKANNQTAVVIQIEHKDALDNLDSILKVDGVDAVLVGPYDLSASYGKAGDFKDPEVSQAISTIVTATYKSGKAVGMFAANAEKLNQIKTPEVSLIAVGTDLLFMHSAAVNELKKLKD